MVEQEERNKRREVKLRFRKNKKEEILWRLVSSRTDMASFVKDCIQYYYDHEKT